jgi:hypothetical protein
MDLITTMAGTILGWFVALAAHVVARDAYANAPRYAQRLIEAAIKSLPENDQARYCEEWLADLNERTGVLSKFTAGTPIWRSMRSRSGPEMRV